MWSLDQGVVKLLEGEKEGRCWVQHTKIDDPMPALHLSLKCTSAFRVSEIQGSKIHMEIINHLHWTMRAHSRACLLYFFIIVIFLVLR